MSSLLPVPGLVDGRFRYVLTTETDRYDIMVWQIDPGRPPERFRAVVTVR